VLDPPEDGQGDESLRHACLLAARLARARHHALPRIVTVGEAEGTAYIASELIEGRTLAELLRNGPLGEDLILRLGRDLAGALAELHRLGLVHRDVKPENIVLASDGRACLVDFDLVAPVESAADEISGTLLYSPPEQMAPARRVVDARSDLYSLGAVLFECAAGKPPFGAAGPGGAAEPPALREANPAISPGLAAVIAKLLASDPADRYQSAGRLVDDLDLIPLLGGETTGQATIEFEPEAPPLPLAGRELELSKLQQQWREALRERGQIVLLRGPGGSGKTYLSRAFLNEVDATGRLALAGRCAEGERTPFGPLRRAFDDWLASFPHHLASQRLLAEQRLKIAAGDFAGLLRRFSPAFEAALGEGPVAAAAELVHERFADVLAEFLLKLAGCYGGLALFLDDVQWLDASTQQVLDHLNERLGGAPLLIVAAVRTDTHGRARGAAGTGHLQPRARLQIRLAPLTEEATEQLVAHMLGAESVPAEIASQVAAWTSGNPLAISEYVDALLGSGVLRPSWGEWTLDTSQLEHLQLPRDVANLLAARVEALLPREREVLRIAALLGGRIGAPTLAVLAGDAAGVDAALRVALARNLLRQTSTDQYEFTHDSVRDALVAGLSPEEAMDLHQHIAEALEQLAASATEHSRHVYAVARHYALGHRARNLQRVHDANLTAGLAAMQTFADADAYEFLRQAKRAAEEGELQASDVLDEALGEVCARAGRWDEALLHLTEALAHAADPLRRAGIHARLAHVRVANRDVRLAWREVELGFEAMGRPISRTQIATAVRCLWCWILGVIALRTGIGYGSAKDEARRARLKMLSQLYVTGAYTAYLLHDNLRLAEMVFRQLATGHLLGDSVEMAAALTSYGNLLALLGRPDDAAAYSARSLAMVERQNDRFQLARMRMFDAWQHHVGGQPRRGEALMRRCLQLDGAWLDAADLVYAHIDLAWNLMMRGYCREALAFVEAALARAQPGSGESRNLEIKAAALLATLGRTREALDGVTSLKGAALESADWAGFGYFSYVVMVLLEVGELGEPLEDALRECRVRASSRRRMAFHGRHFFVLQAYARLEQCMAEASSRNIRRLSEALAELRKVSRHPTMRAHYLVARAAWERLEGRPRPALRQLLAAEEAVLESDNLWAQFELRRQLAHTLSVLENHEAALREARDAYRLAVAQGWVHRAQLVRSEFDALRAAPESAFGHGLPASPGEEDEGQAGRLGQHLEALLQVSLAASSTLEPARQAQVALDEILGVLQAQRAFLFTTTAYGELELRAGRSSEGEDLPDLTGYSRTVVETVRTTCEPVIVSGSELHAIEPTDSMRAHELHSIIAAPVLMKGELLGVVYVDSQLARGAFTEEDVRILQAIANQIAIALQNASAVAQQTALTRANSDLLDALRLQVAELRESRRQITAAEERLRREIAEMLHSRVQSKLLVAAHQLGQAVDILGSNPEEATRLLKLSQEQLEDVREREIRDASHLLHPSIIRIGLAPAIRSLIGRFESVFEVQLEVDPRLAKLDSIVENHLTEELRLTAYRTVEEALANVARHAKASHVGISLALSEDDQVVVRVTDDGAGFDSSQRPRGLGTSSIDGRVNQLGGSWTIQSTPGQGTTVEVRLPVGGV